MGHSFYPDATISIRTDLADAQQQEWERLARPGTWWSGAERLAIAAEVRAARRCAFCKERKSVLSPYAVEGTHDTTEVSAGVLPDAVIEIVHRVVTDPQRLARAFYDKALEAGLTPEQYVEIIATTVLTVSVDGFCHALGVDLRPLPEPQSGEPHRHKAEGKFVYEAFVPMLDKPGGRDADLYTDIPTPIVPNVARALSSVPDELRGLMQLAQAEYLRFDQLIDVTACRSLDRQQTELIATRVSAHNECFY